MAQVIASAPDRGPARRPAGWITVVGWVLVVGLAPVGQAAAQTSSVSSSAPVIGSAVPTTEPDQNPPPTEPVPAVEQGVTTVPVAPTSAPPTTTPADGDGDQPVSTDGQDVDGEGADGEGADDPLSGEGQGEEAPGVDPDIPPPQTYGGQEPYRAPEILWSSVAEAERKLERSRQAKREAVAAVRAMRLRAKHLDIQRRALDDRTRSIIDSLNRAEARYQDRAVTDYRLFAAGVGPEPADVIDPSDLGEVIDRRRGARLATAALGVGSDDLARLGDLRRSLDGEARTILDRLRLVADYQDDAEAAVLATDAEIDQASIEYEAFRAGSEIFVSGVVFPIGGTHNLPLIDSFGFPRMTGTDDEHWHEGIDLFAPRGTPLVATERGIVTRIGSGRLGGLKLWLVGESGSEWYYAHLDSFAPGLFDGQVVEAGDLVGYVGNTGNAVGTPPHLHMQMHPDGGRPVNPYPLLKTVSDLDQEAIAAGTHGGWRHAPVVTLASVASEPGG